MASRRAIADAELFVLTSSIRSIRSNWSRGRHRLPYLCRQSQLERLVRSRIGIRNVRMRTKTFGNLKERLVNDCNEASCRAQNRRVVTVLEQETGI